jgi:hypothetical protein
MLGMGAWIRIAPHKMRRLLALRALFAPSPPVFQISPDVISEAGGEMARSCGAPLLAFSE